MTQYQIIALLHKVIAENQNFTTWTVSTPHLVALVNHAVEAERAACAHICETLWTTSDNGMATEEEVYGTKCAEAIRKRVLL